MSMVSGLIICTIGAKLGSGNYHLIPLIPLLLYSAALIMKDDMVISSKKRVYSSGILLLLILIIISVNALNSEMRLIQKINMPDQGVGMIQEIKSIESTYYGQTIEIGYGGDKTYIKYRQFIPLLVFSGNPYLIDGAAIMDMKLAGLPIPQSTMRELADGKINIWLIPKGDEPFSLHSYYDSSQILFDETFCNTFKQNYQLVQRLQYFDVWMYKN